MKSLSVLASVAIIFAIPSFTSAQVDDSILADDYIITQEFIEAKVVNIKPVSRTITVRGEKRGETRQFSIPKGTRISINGREARLLDIRKGDTVLLAMTPSAEEVVIAQLRVPKTDRTIEERRANPTVVTESTPAMLPKTASNLPTILLLGVLALFAAAGLRAARQ